MHAMPDRLRPALGLAVGLAALLLLLAGCASSGMQSAPAGASASKASAAKARFIAGAQAACRTLKAQEQPLEARQETLKEQPAGISDKAFVSLAQQVVVLSQAAHARLQALARPAADADAITTLLASFSQEIADVSDEANAVAAGKTATGERADQQLEKSIEQNSPSAAAYGMNDCIGRE